MTEKYARKHHFLPQFYLAGFTLSGSKDDALWVLDQKELKRWRSRPRDIANIRDFYRVEVPGVDPDAVEQSFAKIESQIAPVLKKITATHKLPVGDEFGLLLNLVAWLGVTIPAVRNTITGFWEEVAKQMMRLTLQTRERYESYLEKVRQTGMDLGRPVTYEEMCDFVNRDEYRVEVNTTWHIKMIFDGIDAILPTLAARNWSLMIAEPDTRFICSDRPVALVWTTDDVPAFYSPGFGMRNTQLTFPLNREVALIGNFDTPPSTFTADRRQVASLNSRTGMYAERFVYSASEDFIWIRNDNQVCDAQRATYSTSRNARRSHENQERDARRALTVDCAS